MLVRLKLVPAVFRSIFIKYLFFSVKYHPYAPYFSSDTHRWSKNLSKDLERFELTDPLPWICKSK